MRQSYKVLIPIPNPVYNKMIDNEEAGVFIDPEKKARIKKDIWLPAGRASFDDVTKQMVVWLESLPIPHLANLWEGKLVLKPFNKEQHRRHQERQEDMAAWQDDHENVGLSE